MKAEDFYKEHYNEQWQPKDKFDKQKKQFDYYDLIDFAEQYAVKKINYIPCCESDSELLVCGCGKNKPVRREPAYLHCDWCGSITVETK